MTSSPSAPILKSGNDQGLAGSPTGFVTGCTSNANYTVAGGVITVVAPAAGALTNCAGGSLTTPGGSRRVGSVTWNVTNGNILGNILWDPAPVVVNGIQTGRQSSSQTIFPDPNSVILNCNPLIQTKDGLTSTPRSGPTCGIPAISRDITTPYVETWSFGIQHAIVNNVLLDIAYVGNHGVKLLDKMNQNQPFTFSGWTSAVGQANLATCYAQKIANPCTTPDPAVSSTTNGFLKPLFGTATGTAAVLKYPWMGDVTTVVNGDTSNYNGLQVSVTMRNYHGVSAVAGYTYSHALSIADNNNGGLGTDSYNLALDYGAAAADLRHRFSLAPTWSIPGRMGSHGLLDGWKLNGSFRIQTGRPLSFTQSGADFAGTNEGSTGRGNARWDLTGPASDFTTDNALQNGLVRNQKLAQYYPGCGTSATTDPACANLIYTSGALLTAAQTAPVTNPNDINARTGKLFTAADMAINNPACVAAAGNSQGKVASLRAFGCWVEGGAVLTAPAPGSYGNSTKNQFRGLDFWVADASITKRQKFTERLSTEFRVEVFNIFNHPTFAQPSGAIGTSCSAASCPFQTITQTPDVSATNPIIGTGGPRRMQFGVKFLF